MFFCRDYEKFDPFSSEQDVRVRKSSTSDVTWHKPSSKSPLGCSGSNSSNTGSGKQFKFKSRERKLSGTGEEKKAFMLPSRMLAKRALQFEDDVVNTDDCWLSKSQATKSPATKLAMRQEKQRKVSNDSDFTNPGKCV